MTTANTKYNQVKCVYLSDSNFVCIFTHMHEPASFLHVHMQTGAAIARTTESVNFISTPLDFHIILVPSSVKSPCILSSSHNICFKIYFYCFKNQRDRTGVEIFDLLVYSTNASTS